MSQDHYHSKYSPGVSVCVCVFFFFLISWSLTTKAMKRKMAAIVLVEKLCSLSRHPAPTATRLLSYY